MADHPIPDSAFAVPLGGDPLAACSGCPSAQVLHWPDWPDLVVVAGSFAPEVPAEWHDAQRDGLADRNARRWPASLAARRLARQGFAQLGLEDVDLPPHPQGWPVVPSDRCVSLSHSPAYAAAAVALRSAWSAIGVDTEPVEPLPEDVAGLVVSATERAVITGLPGGWVRWSRALFGAKECVHKLVHPRTGIFLEFDEVDVRLQPDGAIVVQALSEQARRALTKPMVGRFGARGDQLICVLAEPV